jgi:hypothetical protein
MPVDHMLETYGKNSMNTTNITPTVLNRKVFLVTRVNFSKYSEPKNSLF